MVMRWKLLLGLLAAGGVAGWLLLGGSEAARVKKQFRRLAETVSKPAGEGNLAMVVKAEGFVRLFAPECELSLPEEELNGSFTPEQLSALLIRGRTQLKTIAVSFPDLALVFPEPDQVVVAATARCQAVHADGRAAVEETRELECELRKLAGEWRFSRITVVQVLKR